MVQLKKDSAWSGDIKVVSNVWTVQQNGATNQAVRDPNYASVKQPKPYTSTYKQPTSLKEDISNVVDKVVKPYSAEDIKLSPMPKPWPEIRPEDTFEETAWGWNYDYDRAVSQERNQQWTLNALQGTGHVAGLSEREVPSVQAYSPAPRGRNLANIWLSLGEWQLEGVDMSSYDTPTATPTASSWANMWASSGGFNWTVAQPQGRQLKNADVNFSQYWDDSSAPNQVTAGGQNDKYTWEFTRNSNIWYDPNITTADLDPNYLFWMDAQWANSDQAGYIARRNDMIASALYNEWKTSKDDVINFLSSQPWWMNSTEADRYNTIESIWKRLGGIEQQNQINDAAQAQADNLPATYSDASLNNMENDLRQSTAWELYGKVTADQDTHIKILEDDNSVYKAMNESRIQTYKQLRWMDSQAIAAAIISNSIASDGQAMRDLMQYDNAKYEYVMQAVKQMRGQMNINAITSWEWAMTTSASGGQITLNNEMSDFAVNNSNDYTNSADILNSINNTLNSNQNYATASEQMASIENDMARLNNRLGNLKKEANQIFKWDVPQYIVNAYVANRTAEIQNEMSILENRYNAAQSRQQQEWERTKWEAEFDLKKQEFDLKRQNAKLDDWETRQWVALKWAEFGQKYWTDWGVSWTSVPASSLSRDQIGGAVDSLIQMYNTWQLWNEQCAAWIQKYYLPKIWVNLGSLSDWSNKQAICNELAGSYSPKKWDIVVMSSSSSPQYWHMGVVVGFDWSDMVYLDWNGSLWADGTWTEEPKLRKTSINNSKIYGYYDPTKNSTQNMGGGVVNWVWTRKDWTQFDIWNSMLFNSLSENDRNTVLWLLNLSIDPTTLQTRYWYDKWQAQKLINAAIDINPTWTDWDKKAAQMAYQAWNKDVQQQWKSKNWTAISTAFEVIDLADKIGNGKRKDWNTMINVMKDKLSEEEFIELNSNIYLLASEYAWALKGTASPTNQDIAEAKQIIASNFSSWWMKAAAESIIRALYNKNANEASNYYQVVLTKPDMLVTPKVAERMAALWLDMTIYWDYNPTWWWAGAVKANNGAAAAGGSYPSNGTYNPQMTQNLFNF